MKTPLAVVGCWLAVCAALRADSLSLSGKWGFALDPLARGEASGWAQTTPPKDEAPAGFDVVTVPHCWSDDPRYEHTGLAWYARAFDVPADWKGRHFRVRFARVADRCRVWLNGSFLGAHDGGSTPFSFDASAFLKPGERNLLTLEVDNSWSDRTLPGSRPGSHATSQVYPWWNYGGILGAVSVETEPVVVVEKIKVEPAFLADGGVTLTIRSWLSNRGPQARVALTQSITAAKNEAGQPFVATESYDLAGGEAREVRLSIAIPRERVRRWNPDDPFLYRAAVAVRGPDGEHTHLRRFGLREIAIRDGQFLLNGRPVRMAGANRARGHASYGGLEPAEMIAEDMRLMKEAHLEFGRLQHTAPTPELLDWADENGVLIMAEAGNWQLQPSQLMSPEMRATFRELTRNMIEDGWDHPSIIAWSTGNEYPSWTPAGVDWTKSMVAWIKTLDATRPVSFAGLGEVMEKNDQPRETRSLHYVDFLCINCYGDPARIGPALDQVHALWPEKPIMISEYGRRADQVSEDVRIENFHAMLALVRARPFVCGLSYWSFNDYRSRYPGTNPNGHREWGLVDAARRPRPLYHVAQTELSPVVLTATRKDAEVVTVKVASRADFPSATLSGYVVRTSSGGSPSWSVSLPELAPGQAWEQDARLPAGAVDLEVVRPTGFTAASLRIDAAP